MVSTTTTTIASVEPLMGTSGGIELKLTQPCGSIDSPMLELYKVFNQEECYHASCNQPTALDQFTCITHQPSTRSSTMAVFVCTATVGGYAEQENFADLMQNPGEIASQFSQLGYECTVYSDSKISSLKKALNSGAELVWIIAHGEDGVGVRCEDGIMSWTNFEENLKPCGLLIASPCFTANAWCEDDEGRFPLRDGLRQKVNAALLTHGSGHHFCIRDMKTKGHFEIHRYARLVKLCKEYGFQQAVHMMRQELNKNFGSIASHVIDHEIAIGHPQWGLESTGMVQA
jgi:hypothetical protein